MIHLHDRSGKIDDNIFRENNEYKSARKDYQSIIKIEETTWLPSPKMMKAN